MELFRSDDQAWNINLISLTFSAKDGQANGQITLSLFFPLSFCLKKTNQHLTVK